MDTRIFIFQVLFWTSGQMKTPYKPGVYTAFSFLPWSGHARKATVYPELLRFFLSFLPGEFPVQKRLRCFLSPVRQLFCRWHHREQCPLYSFAGTRDWTEIGERRIPSARPQSSMTIFICSGYWFAAFLIPMKMSSHSSWSFSPIIDGFLMVMTVDQPSCCPVKQSRSLAPLVFFVFLFTIFQTLSLATARSIVYSNFSWKSVRPPWLCGYPPDRFFPPA